MILLTLLDDPPPFELSNFSTRVSAGGTKVMVWYMFMVEWFWLILNKRNNKH